MPDVGVPYSLLANEARLYRSQPSLLHGDRSQHPTNAKQEGALGLCTLSVRHLGGIALGLRWESKNNLDVIYLTPLMVVPRSYSTQAFSQGDSAILHVIAED